MSLMHTCVICTGLYRPVPPLTPHHSCLFRAWLSLVIGHSDAGSLGSRSCGGCLHSGLLPISASKGSISNFVNASLAHIGIRSHKSLAAINVSPHLSFNHAVHRYPQFLLFHTWPLWPRILPSLSDTPQCSSICLSSVD